MLCTLCSGTCLEGATPDHVQVLQVKKIGAGFCLLLLGKGVRHLLGKVLRHMRTSFGNGV